MRSTRGPGVSGRTRDPGVKSRATAKQPPSTGSTNTARQCLEHLCDSLKRLGVGVNLSNGQTDPTALTPELLRRAKFDQPIAVAPLWRALHDLHLVQGAGFPEGQVCAEVLGVMREEDCDNGSRDFDESATTSSRANATHAAIARMHLALHEYPRLDELRDVPAENEPVRANSQGSRVLLIALAWSVEKLNVFQITHADRCAPVLSQGLGLAVGANSQGNVAFNQVGNNSYPPLPPYPLDTAASAATAKASALDSVASETEYIKQARNCIGKKENTSHLHLTKQTSMFAQRVWQMVASVHALEKGRAVRRVELFNSQVKGIKMSRGAVSSSPSDGLAPLSATEISLARDSSKRKNAQNAMQSVLVTREQAMHTINMSSTFWAWMKSVLDLEEEEDDENLRGDENTESNHESNKSSDGAEPTFTSSLISEVELMTRKIGPLLRSRRKDVETVAKNWRRERELNINNQERSEKLKLLAKEASGKLPGIVGFEAQARATVKGYKGTGHRMKSVTSVRDDSSSLSGFFQSRCSLTASSNNSSPPGVVDNLIKSGACFEMHDDGTADVTGTPSMDDTSTEETWFGAENRGVDVNRNGSFSGDDSRESSAEAVERLRETLADADEMLSGTRQRAVDVLHREVVRVFGGKENTEGVKECVVLHGWDR